MTETGVIGVTENEIAATDDVPDLPDTGLLELPDATNMTAAAGTIETVARERGEAEAAGIGTIGTGTMIGKDTVIAMEDGIVIGIGSDAGGGRIGAGSMRSELAEGTHFHGRRVLVRLQRRESLLQI